MERIRHFEIVPLELSDLRVDGATLWEWTQGRGFSSALRKALEILHEGRGANRLTEPVPGVVSGFEAIFLTGGRVEDNELRRRLSGFPCAVVFGDEPVFSGERGGFDREDELDIFAVAEPASIAAVADGFHA